MPNAVIRPICLRHFRLAEQPVCAGPRSQADDKRERKEIWESHWYLPAPGDRPDVERKGKSRPAMDAFHDSGVAVYYVDAIMMSSADKLLCLRCSFFPLLGAPVGE